jgi:flagellar protein FlaF
LSARRPEPGNPRRTEGWALLEAARRLEEARRIGSGDAVLGAARLNWRLWTIFQASLSDSQCGLPDDLRVKMLSLANFIDRRSAEISAEPKPELLDALVRINLEVGGGMLNAPGADLAVHANAGRPGGEEKRARIAG